MLVWSWQIYPALTARRRSLGTYLGVIASMDTILSGLQDENKKASVRLIPARRLDKPFATNSFLHLFLFREQLGT